jgi:signal transduction histidine kinase
MVAVMNGDISKPERDKTDESLRTERKNTDRVLVERRKSTERSADSLVERAREQADAVLDTAREKADDKLNAAEAGVRARAALASERVEEDEALKEERAAADASLRRERDEQARRLISLLPLEREKTDRYLLTERARSDEAIAHRDDFLGIVSHDLRNLLAGIAGNAKVLSVQASQSDEGRRTIAATQRIERYVARMNRLIGDLVDVVSIDAGKLAMHRQSGDAMELIAEAVEVFGHVARDKGVSLESAISAASLPAVFDRERMLQVLANLLSNAIKFTARGGVITARAQRVGDELLVSVLDTGTGISVDMLEAVFERFWQVGRDDRRGLGLGLYISRCIVDAHGGKIWAESELGTGSAFHFTIPLAVRGSA